MRHHRDESGLAGIELVLKPVGKQPEVIGADVLVAEVVHREIREQPERLALGGLHGDHLQHGILRTARAGDVVPIRRRVHVRPHREIAEGILAHEFRMNNPAAQGGVVARIDLAPADFCGLQLRERCEDGLDQLLHEKGRIDRIRIRAETPHARRRGVGVRRRDEDASSRNARLLRSDFLGLVEEVAPYHATVHDDDDDLFLAVGKRERARVDGRLDLVDRAARHASVDEDRELLRRHIGDRGSGEEFGTGKGSGGEKKAGEKEAVQAHGKSVGLAR